MGIAATRIPAVAGGAASGADEEAARRQELRAFLMSRRARLQPADVGLPETGRRRTPGLRREEVAQLAGLSTEWYTLFEMAKDIGVSRRTIDAVADALKLNPAERRHLHNLVTGAVPAEPAAADVDPMLLGVLEGFRAGPAMLLNARMDVIAANALAEAIFGDLAAARGDAKNWLVYLYESHDLIEAWEAQARQVTATFRGAFCEHATDAAYSGLLERLLANSETFRRYWSEHEVGVLDDAPPLVLHHPLYGQLRFTMRVLAQTTAAGVYCCFLIPDAATAERLPQAARTEILEG
jgi:hypothetical protein